ncbi:MAG: cupin domain-containing protein [Proteobacteria bacterium]|jgi:mannose-6-phosphate isomerase-like protein (cupin superfamily)|nr:cupin domain-containing protein [Pseudomonadota bacterium]MDA1300138.1 cupin domain-containing protein [Pseudomonadota bacterium]
MKIRRVVTGHDRHGKAIFVSDEMVEPTSLRQLPGQYHELWSADAAPSFPDDGRQHPAAKWFPPVGGFRFATFSVAPQSTRLPDDFDRDTAMQELEETLPGMVTQARMEADHPGMHTTDTVDFEYVVSGEVWLELDDGREVHLKPGDTVVQNGTRHAWRNKGDVPCVMVVFLTGAHRQT